MNVLECTQLLDITFHPGLTEVEVRQAWKRSSLAAHPDKGGAQALFHQLTAARDALLLWVAGQQASAAESEAAAAAQRQRTERQVCTALATLAKVQRQWPPEGGHLLGLAEQTDVASSQAVSVPVLQISSSSGNGGSSSGSGGSLVWSKVLTPTGHLLSGPNGRQDHWGWCLPQALRSLLQRFPASAGFALQCSPEGIWVLQHAGSPQQQSSGLIKPAQLAAGSSEWERSIRFHPAPVQPVPTQADGGPETPAATARVPPRSVQPGVPAAQHSTAQRAASIIASFQLVFSSEQLLAESGRRSSRGSEVCLGLYSRALDEVSTHYSLHPPPARADGASSGGSGWQAEGQAVLQAAAGTSGGLKEALPALAAELIQRLLPQLAQHPAGLPACLVPDTGKGGRGACSSIICCCRRFGSTDGCLASFAPGVSVHGLYVDGIGHSRSSLRRSKDGYRCNVCACLAPVGGNGAKRAAAHESALPALPADPLLRARQLLAAFKQAVATGCNPYYPSLPAADGSERCPAGSARSACARAAACAYFDGLISQLGAGAGGPAGPDSGGSIGRAQLGAAGACAEGHTLAGSGAGTAGSKAAAEMDSAAQEYVRLAALLPQLRSTLRQCSRRTNACCGVGPSGDFVCCLQCFSVLAPECCACFDATFCPLGC